MDNIENSSDVGSSRDVHSGRIVYSSGYVDTSSFVDSSYDVDSSRNIVSSRYVYASRVVDSSSYVDSSRVVDASRVVYASRNVLFCCDIKCKEYFVFNKQVTPERYNQIRGYWYNIKGDFRLELKDNQWKEEWKKLPTSVWKKLAELPEFDKEVVEKIIGFKTWVGHCPACCSKCNYDGMQTHCCPIDFREEHTLNLDDEVEITVEGKTVRISRKSAKALGLIK